MSEQNRAQHKTSIGGQALIEGVMMRGPSSYAMAVRQADGEIFLEKKELKPKKWYKKIPIIRGAITFISSLSLGYKTLMKSADVSGAMETEEEPSKFEKWTEKVFGKKFISFLLGIAGVLGVVLSVVLFIFLPTFIIDVVNNVVSLGRFRIVFETVLKLSIFVGYIFLTSKLEDIKRVYMYHGAEHKTIACYEAGEEITPENAAKHSRFHPRCGTSFMLIAILVSVIVFAVLNVGSLWLRTGLKLLSLPIVVGISYEIIKGMAKFEKSIVSRVVSAPGMWLQRLTTREPDEQQLEVAGEALKAVLPREGEDDTFGA